MSATVKKVVIILSILIAVIAVGSAVSAALFYNLS
jgi:hypothetical protein